MTTTSDFQTSLSQLVSLSLVQWKRVGDVDWVDETLHVSAGSSTFSINKAPPDLPFRWVIHDGKRRRTANSVSGLLRVLRMLVDADYQPLRLNIAALPPVIDVDG